MSTTVGRRRETVHIYQGDDLDRLTQLAKEAADARAREAAPASSRLLSEKGAHEAAIAFNEFRDEALGRAGHFVIEALGRVAWRELTRAHPPREQQVTGEDGKVETVTNDEDVSGVNFDTFPDALVPVSIVEPEFESDEARAAFVDNLSDPDFYRLYGVAWTLNRSVADPKALPVYDAIPESDET